MAKTSSDLDKIRKRRQEKLPNEIADWQSADADTLLQAIAVVAYQGGALRFGYTRDGGAYAIGIYLGGEHYTEYVRPREDINAYLAGLVVDIQGSE